MRIGHTGRFALVFHADELLDKLEGEDCLGCVYPFSEPEIELEGLEEVEFLTLFRGVPDDATFCHEFLHVVFPEWDEDTVEFVSQVTIMMATAIAEKGSNVA